RLTFFAPPAQRCGKLVCFLPLDLGIGSTADKHVEVSKVVALLIQCVGEADPAQRIKGLRIIQPARRAPVSRLRGERRASQLGRNPRKAWMSFVTRVNRSCAAISRIRVNEAQPNLP